MDFDELTTFVAVVRTRSLTEAAKVLGTEKAHVSRVVSRLEKKVGARLLQRSTRSLAVMEVGRELYERATGILSALDETQAMISTDAGRTAGHPKADLRHGVRAACCESVDQVVPDAIPVGSRGCQFH
jgi:DNA-binding transcriptional LysR family regulator